jgi:iron complex outermembrane receptor protein
VVSAPTGTPNDPVPRGVSSLTTYDPATGLATRHYDANWNSVTGTAGIEWQPNGDTNVYAKYSRGYKSGGLNIGIFTVLSFQPWTDKETVDAFEVGLKKDFGRTLQTNIALFHYNYQNLQIPIQSVSTAGGLTQASTNFYNVPQSVSQGAELEVTWQPIDHLQLLFNYSYLDAHVLRGEAVDIADPAALAPGAKPLPCPAIGCAPDIFTIGIPGGGFQRFQSLAGNRLPNSPRNKVAFNVNYTWPLQIGDVTASASYLWRDAQYGALFTQPYNQAPSWTQVDARVTWISKDSKTRVIAFVSNLLNDIGYDAGAVGYRFAGTIDAPVTGAPTNVIQGVFRNFSVTPPRTYGVQVQYKFF